MREYFTDKAKTQPLDLSAVEAWGLKHRFASTVREVEGPEVRRDDNHQLHARVAGVWVRVFVGAGRPAKAEGELSASAVRMRRHRAAQAAKDAGVS